jgi:siroheme synthase-like protein
VASYRLAITCTGDPAVDAQVYRDGEAAGVWVNSADDIANCSYYLPAVARAGSISVAVGTDGASPALASFLRRRAQADLDDGVEELAALLVEIRAELRQATGTSEHPAWAPTLDWGGHDQGSLLDVVRLGGSEQAEAILRHALGLASDDQELDPTAGLDREVRA